MPKRQVFGPYRVKNIGVFEVVEMEDNHSNTWMELRPRATYTDRRPAHGKCLRLNRRWQEEHQNEPDILEYWQQATN